MSGRLNPNPHKFSGCSRKEAEPETPEAPKACPQLIEDSFQEFVFEDDEFQNESSDNDDDNFTEIENENADLGEGAQDNTCGAFSITSYDQSYSRSEVGEVNNFSVDEEGGGGRNGGRSTMGDVMTANEPNNNDMNYTPYSLDYGNENNYPNNNEQNDNNIYEDNFNSNFGDVGLQIVVNGNDTNFFV